MSLSSEGREEGYKLSGAKPGPGLGVKVKDDDEINNCKGGAVLTRWMSILNSRHATHFDCCQV